MIGVMHSIIQKNAIMADKKSSVFYCVKERKNA